MFPVSKYLMSVLFAALCIVGVTAMDLNACCGRFGFGGGRIAGRRAQRVEARSSARVGFFRSRSGCSSGACAGEWSSGVNGCVGAACGTADVQAQPPVK